MNPLLARVYPRPKRRQLSRRPVQTGATPGKPDSVDRRGFARGHKRMYPLTIVSVLLATAAATANSHAANRRSSGERECDGLDSILLQPNAH